LLCIWYFKLTIYSTVRVILHILMNSPTKLRVKTLILLPTQQLIYLHLYKIMNRSELFNFKHCLCDINGKFNIEVIGPLMRQRSTYNFHVTYRICIIMSFLISSLYDVFLFSSQYVFTIMSKLMFLNYCFAKNMTYNDNMTKGNKYFRSHCAN
jgi:hypothetical protein